MWLPVELIQIVISRRLLKPFHLYLFLKHHSDGIIRTDAGFIAAVANHYRANPTTLRSWFTKLLELDWVGYDKITRIFYVRSYNTVCQIEGVSSRYNVAWTFNSLSDLEALLGATIFARALRVNSGRYWNQAVPTDGRTFQPDPASLILFRNTAAIAAVASYYGISKSRCERLRTKAIQANYLKAKPQTMASDMNPYVVKTNGSSLLGCFFEVKGKAFRRLPDKLSSLVVIRRAVFNRK